MHLVKPAIKKLHDYFENFHGKKLVFLFGGIFVASLVLGLLMGQIPALVNRRPEEPIYVPNDQGKKVDDVIENDNFVTLLVADTALHCNLTELLSALTAFQTQRTIRLEVEEKLV